MWSEYDALMSTLVSPDAPKAYSESRGASRTREVVNDKTSCGVNEESREGGAGVVTRGQQPGTRVVTQCLGPPDPLRERVSVAGPHLRRDLRPRRLVSGQEVLGRRQRGTQGKE